MPLQHWAHGMYWNGGGAPPDIPGRSSLTLLGVGHGAVVGLIIGLLLIGMRFL